MRVARKPYQCVWCYTDGKPEEDCVIAPREVYARISEVRTIVCSRHFTLDDVTETDK